MTKEQIERMDIAKLAYRKGSITERELMSAFTWQFAWDGAQIKSRSVMSWSHSVSLQNETKSVFGLTDKQLRCIEIRRRWFLSLGNERARFLDYCLGPDMCRARIRQDFGDETAYIVDVYVPKLLVSLSNVRFGKPRRALIKWEEEIFISTGDDPVDKRNHLPKTRKDRLRQMEIL